MKRKNQNLKSKDTHDGWMIDPIISQESFHCESSLCFLNSRQTLLCSWFFEWRRVVHASLKEAKVQRKIGKVLHCWDFDRTWSASWARDHLQRLKTWEHITGRLWTYQAYWLWAFKADTRRWKSYLYILWYSWIPCARNH